MGWDISEFNKANYTAWYISVGTIDGELKDLIDQYIVEICYADDDFIIQDAKNEIKALLNVESEERKMGAVAEFLVHVFLKYKDFKQECLYFNLEEHSLKKGFDGVYLDANQTIWYIESKSGSNISNTHKDKVEEAYRDLKGKFAGTTDNNPWRNALNHAKNIDPGNDKILKIFRNYTKDFIANVSHSIEDFCIIPCGSLYLVDKSKQYIPSDVINGIDSYFSNRNTAGLCIICITQQTIKEFEKYLDI